MTHGRLRAAGPQVVRLAGWVALAAGLLRLALAQGDGVAGALGLMAVGALVASAGVLWRARRQRHDGAVPDKALRHLAAGCVLKLLAVPLVAAGGVRFSEGAADASLAIGLLGLGLAAYAYGVVVRLDGLARLPEARSAGGL